MSKPIGLLEAFYQMFEETYHEMERAERKPVRQGPPDYVDMPDGTRINSSTPRKNPNLR